MINKIDNSKLILHFFIKDQTTKFQYIFVLLPDLNTVGNLLLWEIISEMYIQQVISQKYATKLWRRTTKFQNLGIEGQIKLWKNQFYRLLKISFFNVFDTDLVQLTNVYNNTPVVKYFCMTNNFLM